MNLWNGKRLKRNRRRNDPATLWRDHVLHGPDAADCSLLSKVRSFGLVCGRPHWGLATRLSQHGPCVRTCWTRVGAFKSQQQLLFSPFSIVCSLIKCYTPKQSEPLCRRKNKLSKFGKQKQKIEEERSEGTEALSSFWKQPKLSAVETSRKHHKESQVCSGEVGYLTVDGLVRRRSIGILDFHGHWRRVRQRQGFAVKGHQFAHCENKHVHRYRYI